MNNLFYFLILYRECKKFGRQAWLVVIIVFTELMIVLKFDWETVTRPFPPHVSLFWLLFTICIVAWTIWHFYIKRAIYSKEKKLDKSKTKSN